MTERFDTIILGQGLAGTTLAWSLLFRGQHVAVIDACPEVSSSRVAAGLMTPIIGKRLTRARMWDRMWPVAVEFYRRVEQQLAASILETTEIVRIFRSDEESRYFESERREQLADLLLESSNIPEDVVAPSGDFAMAGGRLHVSRLIDLSRAMWRTDRRFFEASVDVAHEICPHSSGVSVSGVGLQADRLVFCQGFTDGHHPFFPGVEFDATGGEILKLLIPDFECRCVLNQGTWLTPDGSGRYLAGSTTERDVENVGPTERGQRQILSGLSGFLNAAPVVEEHWAAVRPIVEGRFPVIGIHPDIGEFAYFNGLGSRGSVQAPYIAGQLAELLISGVRPDDVYNLATRFENSGI